MQIRLQYLEWLSIDIGQDSGITCPIEWASAESVLCKQYKNAVKYWTLAWFINVIMQVRLPYSPMVINGESTNRLYHKSREVATV